MEWKWDVDVQEGGYWSDGVGGDLTFICKEGVNGSSFFTCTPPILFNPFPVSQYSRFHQMIPCTPASVLLFLCACLNALFNCTIFSASHLILSIFLALAQFFFLLLWSASSSWSKSWRSNKDVFHWTRQTYESLSIVFGSVKKNLLVLRIALPSSKFWFWGSCWWIHFCEQVFLAGEEYVRVLLLFWLGSWFGMIFCILWWFIIFRTVFWDVWHASNSVFGNVGRCQLLVCTPEYLFWLNSR